MHMHTHIQYHTRMRSHMHTHTHAFQPSVFFQVIKVLSRYCDCVERASIDEAFLDVTSVVMERIRQHPEVNPLITSSMIPGTHIAGYTAECVSDGELLYIR